MNIDAIVRAARILQAQPGHSMPLRDLHARLVAELGAAAGSYAEIYRRLHGRTDFALLNSPRLLASSESWPGTVREAYDQALENAGFGSCTRVALTEPLVRTDADDLLAALSATLAEITAFADGNDALTVYIEAANLDLAALSQSITAAGADRPTTPLPDPPPPA